MSTLRTLQSGCSRAGVSANPRAHMVHAGQTKSRCWWATQPGCRCRVARGAWSCLLPEGGWPLPVGKRQGHAPH
uniref:Uncharacterized protein n=1 Tax=Chrysemys picta bellii TaxID=8478 RepID=A0A8C3FWA1_CHRPI